MVYEIEELIKKMIESYTDFQKNKNFISVNKDNEILEKEYKKIKNGKFTLMIAGEAKSGKSTFINAFLGKEILPTDVKQCTSSIIKIKYGENLSLILKYMNESKIITDFETIKRKLKEKASVNEEYRSLPVFLMNEFILRNQNSINEKMIEKFIKSVEKENIYGYSYKEYSQKIRNYIQDKKKWNNIVTEIEISYPFENDILKNVVIIDSPGVNAEGRLGDITNRIIKDVDAIIFVKAISGQALEKSSFMEFIKENSNGKDKESIFLLLTRSVDVKKEELEVLKEEAIKMYGNRIDPRQIKYLDSKVQLFINEIKEMSPNEIEEHLEKLEKEKLYFDFMTPPLRMKELNNEYIEYLKGKSNFDNIYKDIIKFIYENQYRRIESFLNKIKAHTVLKNSYEEKKQKVLELNERFQEIIEKNDIKKKVSQIQRPINGLDNQIENIKKDKFVLMIAGEAKSGKSTFINAYLGEDILSMDVKQCTSSIIEIKYGTEFSLSAEYADGRKSEIKGRDGISKFLKENAALNDDYRDIPVPTINSEILVKYKDTIPERVINDLIKGVKEDNIYNLPEEEYNTKIQKYIEENKNKWQNIITKMVISYPFKREELRNIEIIDSPGVNAAGHVGDVSENYIEKANAIMFLKPITGQVLEASPFKKFLDNKSMDRNKGTLFLILTRAVNVNGKDLEILKKEAKRIYGSKIREEQIVAVDSKVQMFLNEISKYSTNEDIEEYLDELEENNQFEDFMNIPRRIRKEKNSYINYLTEKSRFKDINEAIEKFARKTQYYALDEVVKGILNICKKIEDSIKYDMELYIKNSTEFDIQIFKIQNNINIVNERIYKKVDKMREKYMSYNPKGIIEMRVEENFLKLIKEINNLNGKSENYINNLEEKVFKKIEELKEFYEIIQKNIVREFNKEIFPLRDRFEISYLNIEREFTKKDFENMKNESKKNAYEKKSYEKGFLFKKSYHYSEYSQVKHFMILKYDVINRIEEINNKIKINLINFIQNIINKYIEILFQNMKNQKQKLLELQEEREVIEEKIVKLRHIIQEVSSFRNKVRLFERKIEEDI